MNDRRIDYYRKNILGKIVNVTVDRPIGSMHPIYKDTCYELNYGYIEGTLAPDGEEQDAYVIGIDAPISNFEGVVVAVIFRTDDIEEKWVVAPVDSRFSKQNVIDKTSFIEKYFKTEVYM